MKFEKTFTSQKNYENVLYEVNSFTVTFKSPTGREQAIHGFWDGGTTWKVRFAPDEVGTWSYTTRCSDSLNTGLHGQRGTFACTAPSSRHAIFTKGSIIRPKASYYLSHADGTPFFYAACTAWNGPLKSTDEEWSTYLKDRAANHYNVIQFAATQWRGCDKNSLGQVAFTGSGRIALNPDFFQHLDKKIDEINAHGLIAAPVLLWALPAVQGRELSPGYYLPDDEAILLAKYLVARYGGHQVIWILGGDAEYLQGYEMRWKKIGRAVFGKPHPGVTSLHPHGRSWIGKEYGQEDWLDIVGYQTGHNNSPSTATWITSGPVASEWAQIPPKVFINMEPCYEDITPAINAPQVRNASYWSVFSTPVAGIAYGANGIWPWLRPGEEILNHRKPHILRPWDESIKLPGSVQVGYLADFMNKYPWWTLKPAPELLAEQPGTAKSPQYISVVRSDDQKLLLAYVPGAEDAPKATVRLHNGSTYTYTGQWFDPATNKTTDAKLQTQAGILEATPTGQGDRILILTRK
ncbi:DUF4038 domain-containing protein [Rhabdobacter roseus]